MLLPGSESFRHVRDPCMPFLREAKPFRWNACSLSTAGASIYYVTQRQKLRQDLKVLGKPAGGDEEMILPAEVLGADTIF
jgi:hypothetical protein